MFFCLSSNITGLIKQLLKSWRMREGVGMTGVRLCVLIQLNDKLTPVIIQSWLYSQG